MANCAVDKAAGSKSKAVHKHQKSDEARERKNEKNQRGYQEGVSKMQHIDNNINKCIMILESIRKCFKCPSHSPEIAT